MSVNYKVRSKLNAGLTLISLGLGLSCLVTCARASVSVPVRGRGSGTARFTNKFIPGAVQQQPQQQQAKDSDSIRAIQLQSFVKVTVNASEARRVLSRHAKAIALHFLKDKFKKVVFNVIDVEFGASSEWGWVASYVDLYWDQLYDFYESKRVKSLELERIERNVTVCLDEVGFVNSKYCEVTFKSKLPPLTDCVKAYNFSFGRMSWSII